MNPITFNEILYCCIIPTALLLSLFLFIYLPFKCLKRFGDWLHEKHDKVEDALCLIFGLLFIWVPCAWFVLLCSLNGVR